MTLAKAHIAQKIANDAGFMKHEAMEVFEKLLDIMEKRLVAGEDVIISGFGKWTVRSKQARRGRNPQTGVPIVLDARKVVTWKYSDVLKEAVNGTRNLSAVMSQGTRKSLQTTANTPVGFESGWPPLK